ncbi:hypothetical protein GCM10011379_07030 [Filimonas zeae]|uniref:Uncharacterized protein n=1 Tax=Filimonas zeae TaxID=1737353 RepID=A0A917IQM8_9BACT|nr:hypothetical protein GCM10011379_07030 [Filimonas zeae]
MRHFITQHIAKQFTLFVYDYKFPDLAKITYNHLIKHADKYKVIPRFYVINFDDLSRTHRCNPISPAQMLEIADATESSRTIMLALNREWIKKVGDFWVESSINFVTAVFWFLRKYEDGKYCTLPHALELAALPYKDLFPVMAQEEEISILMDPFISAWQNNATEQLEGQIGSAKIGLARLSSPQLYYVLSGNDFTLDINNPAAPKIVVAGNNPQRQGIYGAVLSLYAERLLKQINQPGKLKSSVIVDEAPTIYIGGLDNHIGVARGRLCSTTLGIQDISQFRRDYGKEQADVIVNTCANIISGQVLGDSAKLMSDRIGKIMQDRQSISINSSDTSISNSTQLEVAIPPAKIANLSSGHFVGAIADTPQQEIERKTFSAKIINDHQAIANEEATYEEIPQIRTIDQSEVMDNYYQIKQDIKNLVQTELDKLKNDPAFAQNSTDNQTQSAVSL